MYNSSSFPPNLLFISENWIFYVAADNENKNDTCLKNSFSNLFVKRFKKFIPLIANSALRFRSKKYCCCSSYLFIVKNILKIVSNDDKRELVVQNTLSLAQKDKLWTFVMAEESVNVLFLFLFLFFVLYYLFVRINSCLKNLRGHSIQIHLMTKTDEKTRSW